jgi:hypothetical protein
MQRDLYNNFIAWKNSEKRKPLLLKGARQTGKTYVLKEFGKKEYKNLVYCNFEEDPELEGFFNGSLAPQKILAALSLYKKTDIHPKRDLIFFDEIQRSNNALNSLKYFNEEAPEYHVVAAGSLLGVKLSSPKSFPVGKVSIFTLYPMTFSEFLDAIGESRYRKYLETLETLDPLPLPFHNELIGHLKSYYFTGGMPEAVERFSKRGAFDEIRSIQNDIMESYLLDFAKHAPTADIPKLSLIWDSIPAHLARENKKFIFSALSKSARARDYENALRWLQDSGLVLPAHAVEKVQQPLAGFTDRNAFKIYMLDVGLLGAKARVSAQTLAVGDELFTTYHGAFVENFVAQQLIALQAGELCYWKSASHNAEVDFLYEEPPLIFPLEVKAGVNPKSKSLISYKNRFNPRFSIRTTLLNLKMDGSILNVPLYAINNLRRYVHIAMGK